MLHVVNEYYFFIFQTYYIIIKLYYRHFSRQFDRKLRQLNMTKQKSLYCYQSLNKLWKIYGWNTPFVSMKMYAIVEYVHFMKSNKPFLAIFSSCIFFKSLKVFYATLWRLTSGATEDLINSRALFFPDWMPEKTKKEKGQGKFLWLKQNQHAKSTHLMAKEKIDQRSHNSLAYKDPSYIFCLFLITIIQVKGQ